MNSHPALGRAALTALVSACLVVCAPAMAAKARSSRPAATARSEIGPLPNVPLSAQIMFQVLGSEIMLQRGEPGPPFRTYMSLAKETRDPRFTARATEIALTAQLPVAALESVRLWHELAPKAPAVNQMLLSLLITNSRWDEVAPLAKRQLDEAPANERGDEILLLQQRLARTSDTAGALRTLRALLVNDMQRPQALMAIAQAQLAVNDKAGALASLESVLKSHPGYVPAVLFAAEVDVENRPAGIARLRNFLKRDPKSLPVRTVLARLLVADNQLDAAITEYQTLLEASPADGQSIMALALIQMQRKSPDNAEKLLLRLLSLPAQTTQRGGITPQGVNTAYQYLSQIAEQRKDYNAAIDWLDKINDPDLELAAEIKRVQLMVKAGRPDEANAHLAALRKEAATSGDSRRQTALLYAKVGILVDAKDYDGAAAQLKEALQARPDDTDLLYEHAMVLERLGQYDQMEQQLRRVLTLDPEQRQAYNALGYSLADRNIRLPEALSLIQKANTLSPQDPMILDSLGWVQYRLGDLETASKLLEQAYKLQTDPEIAAHLGEVLWQTGHKEQALAIWRDSEAKNPDNELLKKTLSRFLRPDEAAR